MTNCGYGKESKVLYGGELEERIFSGENYYRQFCAMTSEKKLLNVTL